MDILDGCMEGDTLQAMANAVGSYAYDPKLRLLCLCSYNHAPTTMILRLGSYASAPTRGSGTGAQ